MTAAGRRAWACDTSVALAAIDPNHEAHAGCRREVARRRPALSGHAVFECYSVLTRLPPPLRLTAAQAGSVLARAFPEPCWAGPGDLESLRIRSAQLGIVGASVYDALVGQAALVNERTLLTRDQRAERIYRALGVAHEMVD